ncbi:hypothetical protein D9756_011455 [Leucocoprinus leucothites]|uniref:Uncharacterized protein n=1 Tax=Leucocoprinus leucothites TaxID=201217 RepID=A0A8H5FQ02_9AGAR|nr:hypothetical protein D9756_011455 [Leucoagaricus leucothites]
MAEVVTILPGCIPANPDIAGVGIRVTIYLQNAVCALVGIWTIARRREGIPLISAQITGITLTTCALFLSAFIQSRSYGLSAYHAIILLNLGWVNFASSLLQTGIVDPDNTSLPDSFSFFWMHASMGLFAGFGLWFWATVDTFGSTIQCKTGLPIPICILGHTYFGNSSATRIAFLVIYTTFGFNSVLGFIRSGSTLITSGAIFEGLDRTATLSDVRSSRMFLYVYGVIIDIGLLVGVIVGTEWMVHDAASFVQPGESQWTYGQTISVFLLVPGVLGVIRDMAEEETKRQRMQRSTLAEQQLDTIERNGGSNGSHRGRNGKSEVDAGDKM